MSEILDVTDSMTLAELMDEVERVSHHAAHDTRVIAEEVHPRGEGLAFDIKGLEVVDGVVRVKLV